MKKLYLVTYRETDSSEWEKRYVIELNKVKVVEKFLKWYKFKNIYQIFIEEIEEVDKIL